MQLTSGTTTRKITPDFSFVGMSNPLSEVGLQRACDILEIDLPVLLAIMQVETMGCGFLRSRRPVILFERHIFCRYTEGRFSAKCPGISNTVRGGYGQPGEAQYDRLREAMSYDCLAALYSCSWGIGQIMGYRFEAAGYKSSDGMILDFCDSENSQLMAMARFIRNMKLIKHLLEKDWEKFAIGYNGPAYAENKYAERLIAAHEYHKTGAKLDCTIRADQINLMFNGFYNGAIDGICGPKTIAARTAMEQSIMRA